MQQQFKEVTIGDQKFQIGRMTARNGSWVLSQVMTKILPDSIAEALGKFSLPSTRSQISEDEFHNLQDHCLNVCCRVETVGAQVTPLPIFKIGVGFLIPELEYDLIAIMALTIQALLFNIEPFFDDAAKAVLMNSLKDSKLFLSQPSTGSASPQS